MCHVVEAFRAGFLSGLRPQETQAFPGDPPLCLPSSVILVTAVCTAASAWKRTVYGGEAPSLRVSLQVLLQARKSRGQSSPVLSRESLEGGRKPARDRQRPSTAGLMESDPRLLPGLSKMKDEGVCVQAPGSLSVSQRAGKRAPHLRNLLPGRSILSWAP